MPALYLSDLMTEFLSPAHWEEFVLPCYRRIAAAVGGIVLAMPAPDPRVLPAAGALAGSRGCSAHRDLPHDAVASCLAGRGVYLLSSHPYCADFDRPTLAEGQYDNPRVAHPSASYRDVLRALAGRVPVLTHLERAHRVQALRAGEALRRWRVDG